MRMIVNNRNKASDPNYHYCYPKQDHQQGFFANVFSEEE